MPDVSKDPHTPNALLEQFGMKAYAGVPLLADGVPLGVLYAIDREVRQYSERDIGFLTAVASRAATAMVKFRLFESLRESNFRLAGEVAERRLAQQEISASLREKEVMLQEIHHRVKNNLQIVSSLLNLQARDQRDPALREAFADSQQRIRSMALIHEMLYQSDDLAKIDFAKYLRAFIPVLLRSYGTGGGRLTHNILADDIALSPETAVPLGLIVNELVTNSIKHAFPDGRAGRITIECRNCEGVLSLSVGDDGAGLPADFSPEKSGSLGMRLVAMLSKQLAARLEMRNHDGTAFLLVCTLPGAPAQP
jgi:two-component sensor histidine kinase